MFFENKENFEYLADSQFDFPGNKGGWQYSCLNAENKFGTWKFSSESEKTATPRAFLVNEDPDCIIGRDFVQPGYINRPVMEWHTQIAGKYLIEGELSLVRSVSHGKFTIRIYVDDVCRLDEILDYPEILEFSIPISIGEAGGFVRIVFGAAQYIDNNYCLYYACIRGMDSDEFNLLVPNIRKSSSDKWSILEGAISRSLSIDKQGQQFETLARSLFGDMDLRNKAVWPVAHSIQDRIFGKYKDKFRKPGMFSVSKFHADGVE